MGCHSLDEDDVGPRHRGVVGRVAGTVPSYAYSSALKNSHIVWDRETLDRWLTNPQALATGRKDVLCDAKCSGSGRRHRVSGRTALDGTSRRWLSAVASLLLLGSELHQRAPASPDSQHHRTNGRNCEASYS
jgi:hypothetical protein